VFSYAPKNKKLDFAYCLKKTKQLIGNWKYLTKLGKILISCKNYCIKNILMILTNKKTT